VNPRRIDAQRRRGVLAPSHSSARPDDGRLVWGVLTHPMRDASASEIVQGACPAGHRPDRSGRPVQSGMLGREPAPHRVV
jgi:hypothetical protein